MLQTEVSTSSNAQIISILETAYTDLSQPETAENSLLLSEKDYEYLEETSETESRLHIFSKILYDALNELSTNKTASLESVIKNLQKNMNYFLRKGVNFNKPDEAEIKEILNAIDTVLEDVSDDKESLISELEEIAEACSVPDWDGYDAVPIESHIIEAVKNFIYALPDNLPLPEVAPEPDGALSLDWIWSKDRVFSLSIGQTEELSYAWIDNGERGYGVARFNERNIPKRVMDLIQSFLS